MNPQPDNPSLRQEPTAGERALIDKLYDEYYHTTPAEEVALLRAYVASAVEAARAEWARNQLVPITADELAKIDRCRPLLPDPAPAVVGELVAEAQLLLNHNDQLQAELSLARLEAAQTKREVNRLIELIEADKSSLLCVYNESVQRANKAEGELSRVREELDKELSYTSRDSLRAQTELLKNALSIFLEADESNIGFELTKARRIAREAIAKVDRYSPNIKTPLTTERAEHAKVKAQLEELNEAWKLSNVALSQQDFGSDLQALLAAEQQAHSLTRQRADQEEIAAAKYAKELQLERTAHAATKLTVQHFIDYADGQDLRSDFRTAREMRDALEQAELRIKIQEDNLKWFAESVKKKSAQLDQARGELKELETSVVFERSLRRKAESSLAALEQIKCNPDSLAHELAESFLRWPLPEGVCADLCATKQGPGRIGTNLLSYIEAKKMMHEVVIPMLVAKRLL